MTPDEIRKLTQKVLKSGPRKNLQKDEAFAQFVSLASVVAGQRAPTRKRRHEPAVKATRVTILSVTMIAEDSAPVGFFRAQAKDKKTKRNVAVVFAENAMACFFFESSAAARKMFMANRFCEEMPVLIPGADLLIINAKQCGTWQPSVGDECHDVPLLEADATFPFLPVPGILPPIGLKSDVQGHAIVTEIKDAALYISELRIHRTCSGIECNRFMHDLSADCHALHADSVDNSFAISFDLVASPGRHCAVSIIFFKFLFYISSLYLS